MKYCILPVDRRGLIMSLSQVLDIKDLPTTSQGYTLNIGTEDNTYTAKEVKLGKTVCFFYLKANYYNKGLDITELAKEHMTENKISKNILDDGSVGNGFKYLSGNTWSTDREIITVDTLNLILHDSSIIEFENDDAAKLYITVEGGTEDVHIID